VVDDGSTDNTHEILIPYLPKIKLMEHYSNEGKGSAIQTGLSWARGGVIFIQDADLEYPIEDIPKVIEPIIHGGADVVYGSRFLMKNPTKYSTYEFGNKVVSWFARRITGRYVTDMETCYKAFRYELIEWIKLEEKGFGIEPELTVKLLKKGNRFKEVPIKYKPRSKEEGKKIRPSDGLWALWVLIREKVKR